MRAPWRGAVRVKAYVAQHLCEPALDPASVSQGVGLSTRYINKLFKAENSSPGRFIWQRRLDHCAMRLRDPSWAHASISTIALEHGFNDLSHFSRSFRERLGMSPREYRATGH